MPKPTERNTSALPSGAHRSDASSLGALAGGQRRRRTDAPSAAAAPATVTAQPPPLSAVETPIVPAVPPADLTKLRLADVKVYGQVYDDFERVLRLLQTKVGWRVNKTEVLTAIAKLLIAAEPTLAKRPAASAQASRPPNQDHQAKEKAERELAVWLHRLLRDAEVVES